MAERELARVRDSLSDAVESMTHGIMLFDRDRRLVLFNRQVLGHYVGPSDMLTIGNKFEENIAAAIEHGKIPLAPGQTAAAFIAERLAKFERASGEITERHMPDGRILHISDHRTLSGGTVSMGIDVTERVRIEQRLREVQRMESIGQLTGGLAHDFNNYLAVVIGNLDLLADCRYDDPEAPKLIEGALAGAQRGAELTRSLLAFSRRQPLNPRSLDVGQRVNDVARLLKRTIGEKITLDVQVAPATVAGRDRRRAARQRHRQPRQQCARRHARWRHADLGRAQCRGGDRRAAGGRSCADRDDRHRPGHGRGHAGARLRAVLLDQGPRARHRTWPQHGSRLRAPVGRHDPPAERQGPGNDRAALPARARRGPIARPAPAGAALPRGTESVLVVEDNADVRAMVVTQIKSLGYRVVEAESGDAALAVLEERPGGFDLLISDMVMPGEIDGLDLAKMARQRWPKLAILLTTGFSDVIVDEAGDGKAVDFGVLRKPYRKADLARAMRAALAV